MVCGKDGFKFIQLIVFLLLDVFLHHLLNNLFETDSEAFRKDIYQCYHCIYGVHLGVSCKKKKKKKKLSIYV
jgi:hypothetical protein